MKPGPTARAALVLVAFLAVFLIVDRMSAPGGARRTAAAPPASAAPQPDTSASPTTTTIAPTTTTRAPTTTAPPTTKRATGPTLRPATGVSVQVLNGVWVTGLAHRVAGQVRAAGYVNGQSGYFQQEYFVYDRAGVPCRVCGTEIRQIRQGQRSTFYCVNCQK